MEATSEGQRPSHLADAHGHVAVLGLFHGRMSLCGSSHGTGFLIGIDGCGSDPFLLEGSHGAAHFETALSPHRLASFCFACKVMRKHHHHLDRSPPDCPSTPDPSLGKSEPLSQSLSHVKGNEDFLTVEEITDGGRLRRP